MTYVICVGKEITINYGLIQSVILRFVINVDLKAYKDIPATELI